MMKKTIIRMLAMIISIAMLFAICGCSEKDTGSIIDEDALNYADEVIDDLEADDEAVAQDGNASEDGKKDNSDKNDKTNGSNKGSGDKSTSSSGKTNSSGDKGTSSSGKTTTTNKTQTTNKKPSSGGNTIDYGDKFNNDFAVDEDKKASFLESVPASLKGKEVSILTWWQPFEHEKKKMEKFTKETGIKIKLIYADQASYLQRLATLRAQGNSPDIAAITVENYPNAILLDYFRPISDSKIDISKKDVFDIDSMNLLKFNGKHYGIIVKGTTYITMGILAYNAKLFDDKGITSPQELWDSGKWNWDTFIQTALDIQKATGLSPLASGYSGYRLAQTSGQDAIAFKDGKLVNNMKNETYREGYKFVSSLTSKGEYNVLIPHEKMYDDFLSGQIAMIWTENWILQQGERLTDSSFPIGFAPLPCKSNKTIVPSDAQLWGFPTGAKNIEAASYALEYWHDPKYTEEGYDLWMSDSAAGFMDWMWKQPKSFKISQGVFDYGGEGSFWDYNFMILEDPNKIDSYIDSRMSFVDANLKKIYETK